VWAIAVMSLITPASIAVAQSADQQASTLTHQLMSPYCPGLLLADCQSEGARQLRAEILHRLRAGETSDAIERDVFARFGSAIRTAPEFGGAGLIVWLGPLLLGLASLGIVGFVVRRATSRDSPSGTFEHRDLRGDGETALRIQYELDALD
jgi:cytochrome c-type biogenesis protein CcmH/NrfF